MWVAIYIYIIDKGNCKSILFILDQNLDHGDFCIHMKNITRMEGFQ